mmetsp:Transcript_13962/g.33201  ORF Transcript_13962/g.33201 Transcript_13962/m.33201 type:complete len:372 (+) Transcript_13962:1577-2692(+)
MALLESIIPALPPPLRIMMRVHACRDHLVYDSRNTSSSRLKLFFQVFHTRQLSERSQRPDLLGMEGTLAGLLASVLRFHVAFQSATCVAELEHQALGKGGEVDGVRVRHVMESRIEPLLRRKRNWHAAIYKAFRVHHRSGDCENLNVMPLLVIRLLQVKNEHQKQRMSGSAGNHRVAQDGIGLVFSVRLIGDHKTCLFAQLEDSIQGLLFHGNHVSIDIEASIMPKELQSQNVCLALPHLLLMIDLVVDHRQLCHLLVVPEVEAPARIGSEVLHPEGIDPKAWRLLRANPDLMDHLRNLGLALQLCLLVLQALRLPGIRISHSALTSIPMIEGAYRLNHQGRKRPEQLIEILLTDLSNQCAGRSLVLSPFQ